MQIPRPPAIGDQYAVKQLRSVLFSEPILAAAQVRPKGYMKLALLAPLLGWWGPLLARRATEPLPPTMLYLAVTPADIRMFSKPGFADPFEIGRWTKGTYRCALSETRFSLRLDLELERLGRVSVYSRRNARPVFDLVAQGAKA